MLISLKINAQLVAPEKKDSIKLTAKQHSPRLATMMSALLPGSGQLYNKKYWKAPIAWAGIGTFGYLFIQQQQQFKQFKTALAFRLDNDLSTVDKFPQFTEAQLRQARQNYQYNRDLMAVITGVYYLLNIIDANVDAHLFGFDVSENLSINLTSPTERSIGTTQTMPFLSLTFNLSE